MIAVTVIEPISNEENDVLHKGIQRLYSTVLVKWIQVLPEQKGTFLLFFFRRCSAKIYFSHDLLSHKIIWIDNNCFWSSGGDNLNV